MHSLFSSKNINTSDSNAPIRIVFIIDFIFGTTGGTENQLLKILKHLDKKKFKTSLIALKSTDWLSKNKNIFECPVFAFDYDIYQHGNPKNLLVIPKVIYQLKKLKPHIVICFYKISYIIGVLCAFWAGARNIISTRRDYGLWLDGKSEIFLRITNRFVKGIVTNSENVRQLTSKKEKYPLYKILVIYNGIEFKDPLPKKENIIDIRKKLGISHNQKLIGLVAGLRPMKRHETFLKAAGAILQKRQDVDFLVIGDGPRRQELENLSEELHISPHVHFLGWNEDVNDLLLQLDIGINCSANEGLSNAIMEYMAHGIPCVVSRAGGNSELIKDGFNGFLFTLGDWEQLAYKIQVLLDDKELRQQFAQNSKELIFSKFSVTKMITHYEHYFETIVTT